MEMPRLVSGRYLTHSLTHCVCKPARASPSQHIAARSGLVWLPLVDAPLLGVQRVGGRPIRSAAFVGVRAEWCAVCALVGCARAFPASGGLRPQLRLPAMGLQTSLRAELCSATPREGKRAWCGSWTGLGIISTYGTKTGGDSCYAVRMQTNPSRGRSEDLPTAP